MWCINNTNLLNHDNSSKWVTVFYEDLIRNPELVFGDLLKKMGICFTKEDIKKINFKKPSRSNFNGDYKVDITKQLESFLDKLSKKELQKLQDIFTYFGVSKYSAFSAYPSQ